MSDFFLERNPGISFIAEINGNLAGSILAGHDGRRGYLYHLAVEPNVRRKGIGRQLVQASLKKLQEKGILKCHIFIFNTNETGKTFWESVGWSCREDITVASLRIE